MKLQHVSFLLYGMTAAISNFSYRRRETEKFRLLSLLECIRWPTGLKIPKNVCTACGMNVCCLQWATLLSPSPTGSHLTPYTVMKYSHHHWHNSPFWAKAFFRSFCQLSPFLAAFLQFLSPNFLASVRLLLPQKITLLSGKHNKNNLNYGPQPCDCVKFLWKVNFISVDCCTHTP